MSETSNKLAQVLERKAERSLKEIQDGLVDNTKLLLTGNESNEREIIRELGLDTTHRVLESARERVIITEKLKERHEGTVYHISDIKDLALKYRLKFLPTDRFRKPIPADLPSILARFYEKEGIVASGKSSHNASKFKILAPPSEFSGTKVKWSYTRPVIFDNDPMVFAQVSEDGEYWVLLKAWGNDFMLKRRMLGSLLKTEARVKALGFIVFLVSFMLNVITHVKLVKYVEYLEDIKSDYFGVVMVLTALSVIFVGLLGSIWLVITWLNWLDRSERSGIEPKPEELATESIWSK